MLFNAAGMRGKSKNNAKKRTGNLVIMAGLRYTAFLEGTMCDNVQLTGFNGTARLISPAPNPSAGVPEFDARLTHNPDLICQQFIAKMSAHDQVGVCIAAYAHRHQSNEQPTWRSDVATQARLYSTNRLVVLRHKHDGAEQSL